MKNLKESVLFFSEGWILKWDFSDRRRRQCLKCVIALDPDEGPLPRALSPVHTEGPRKKPLALLGAPADAPSPLHARPPSARLQEVCVANTRLSTVGSKWPNRDSNPDPLGSEARALDSRDPLSPRRSRHPICFRAATWPGRPRLPRPRDPHLSLGVSLVLSPR